MKLEKAKVLRLGKKKKKKQKKKKKKKKKMMMMMITNVFITSNKVTMK